MDFESQGGPQNLPAEDSCCASTSAFFADLIHQTAPLSVFLVPFQLAKKNDLVLMKINGLKLSHKSQGAGGLSYKYLPGS
jgi:hypothetical protein